jgi:hypothetical protein
MENVPFEKSDKKYCCTCKKLFTLDNFFADNRNRDKLKYVCKHCCRKSSQERYRKRKYLAESKGLCLRYGCQFRSNKGGNLCAMHFYKAIATAMKRPAMWSELEKLAEKQDYICSLTGDKLLAGVNMSLDHIRPVSKYPELTGDIRNMQWVTKWANFSKHDLTVDEFAANCLKVVSKCRVSLESK